MRAFETISFAGIRTRELIVPAFELKAGEFVGLTFPALFGVQMWNVVEALSKGLLDNNMHAPVGPILALPDIAQFLTPLRRVKLRNHAASGATPRMLSLVDMACKDSEADLILLSSSGLDPMGVQAVGSTVRANLGRKAAIDLISANNAEEKASLARYTRVIQCTAIQSETEK